MLVQDVLKELDMDKWADMEGKLAKEENTVSQMHEEGLLSN